MHKRVYFLFSLTFAFALALAGLPSAALAQSSDSPAAQDIVEIAAGNSDFSTLVTLVGEAELVDALKAEGPYTVFAPTDDAFAKVPSEVVDALLADKDLLTQVLLYHVVDGKVMAADVQDGASVETLQGESVTFTVADGAVKVNDANVVAADVEASNGVIHVIDSVIVPQAVLDALTAASAAEAAPAAEASAAEAAPAAEELDIVDTAVGAGSFSTLVTLVGEAELVDALKAEGPYTVFAPTDEAFAKLPKATVDALLADPQGALKDILLYHVVPGKVMAADVTDGAEAKTLQGEPITFSVKDGSVMANDASVVAADVEASNGVIHVIDSVILPPSMAAAEAPAAAAAPAAAEATAADAAPEQMPVTGDEPNNMLLLVVMATMLVAIAGAAVVSRRQMAQRASVNKSRD